MSKTHRVVFQPSGRRGTVEDGASVLAVARAFGVDLDSVCGGRGLCGRCQIDVADGEFPKHAIASSPRHLSAAGAVEDHYSAKRGPLREGRRLGCQARIHGDLVIDVPPDSQIHRQVVRKDAEARVIAIDPVVRLHYVEIAEPEPNAPLSEEERLRSALWAQWGLECAPLTPGTLRTLQSALREGRGAVMIALREECHIVALWAGFRDTACGVAIDIGSTTLAAHLLDLTTGAVLASAGAMNPQIRFGEDLMSRVSHATLHANGATEMTSAVRAALDALIGSLVAEAGIDRTSIVEATIVGNPVMHHLFLGIDPSALGTAPFTLAVEGAVTMPAREAGLVLAEGAQLYILPCIAGHVGADTAGVILSEAPHKSPATTLLIDIGTNAEVVLGDATRLLACSSPTGPAFEGAQISCGQRAAAGAIERVRIDPVTLEPRYRIISAAPWSDEPGFDEEAAKTGVTGVCGSGIIEVLAELYLAGVLRADGTIDGAAAQRSPRVFAEGRTFSYLLREGPPRLVISQMDIRAIQVAKAALHAGARLLMDRMGVTQVERIILAGAFGSHIDTKYAMILGLIPACGLAHVAAAGNAAGTGACIALLNRAARQEIEDLVPRIEKVEIATEPKFQEYFVDAMAIPHRTSGAEALRYAGATPPQSAEARAPTGRRRRH